MAVQIPTIKTAHKRNSIKMQAHRAYKRHKAGLKLTKHELTLLEVYYPFVFDGDER